MSKTHWLTWRLLVVLSLGATVFTVPAWAGFLMFEEFTNPGPPSNLTLYADPGFSASCPAGWAVFTKAAGTGNGFMRLVTDFWVSGDFTAVTVADRVKLPAGGGLGLALCYTWPPVLGDSLADVLFFGTGQICAWVFPFTTNWANEAGSEAWFQIRRVGSTVYDEYGFGANYAPGMFVTLASWTDASLAAPVRVGLFMAQEQGNPAAQEGQFDILAIVTPGGVPEPAPSDCWAPACSASRASGDAQRDGEGQSRRALQRFFKVTRSPSPSP